MFSLKQEETKTIELLPLKDSKETYFKFKHKMRTKQYLADLISFQICLNS